MRSIRTVKKMTASASGPSVTGGLRQWRQSSSIATAADELRRRASACRALQVRPDDAGGRGSRCERAVYPTMEYTSCFPRFRGSSFNFTRRASARAAARPRRPSTLTHADRTPGRRAAGSCRMGSPPAPLNAPTPPHHPPLPDAAAQRQGTGRGASASLPARAPTAPRGERDRNVGAPAPESDAITILTLTSPSGRRVGARPDAADGGFTVGATRACPRTSLGRAGDTTHLAQRCMMLREHERVTLSPRPSREPSRIRSRPPCRRFSSRDIRGASSALVREPHQVGGYGSATLRQNLHPPHSRPRLTQVPKFSRGGADGQTVGRRRRRP